MKLKSIECVTEAGLRKLVVKAADGNPTGWSKDHDITPQQTSAFLRQTQTAGLKVPAVFGLVPVTVYVPADSDLLPEPPEEKAPPKVDKKKSKKDKKASKKAKNKKNR